MRCFICPRQMQVIRSCDDYTDYECAHCEVEERVAGPGRVFWPGVSTWDEIKTPDGEVIPLIDHSVEHWPSPA